WTARQFRLGNERLSNGPGGASCGVGAGPGALSRPPAQTAGRAELQLHGDTHQPGSLALREAAATDSEPPPLRAAPVPAGGERSAYKQALIQDCSSSWLLAQELPRAYRTSQ